MADKAVIEAGGHQAAKRTDSVGRPPSVPQKWRCLNCGQLVFAAAQEAPADVCQGCRDMTTWQALDE